MTKLNIGDLISEKWAIANTQQWGHEATDRNTGEHLFTSVVSNHATRGQWQAILVKDGKWTRLNRVPNIRAKRWLLTDSGAEIVAYGRY